LAHFSLDARNGRTRLAFAPDGQRIAVAAAGNSISGSCSVNIVHSVTGAVLNQIVLPGSDALCWLPDGERLVVAARDGAHVCDTRTQMLQRPPGGHLFGYSAAQCVAVRPDGRSVYVGFEDGAIREWDLSLASPAIERVGVDEHGVWVDFGETGIPPARHPARPESLFRDAQGRHLCGVTGTHLHLLRLEGDWPRKGAVPPPVV
jgi:hypothetical protein